ncbi:hypothetical protein ACJX0J_041062, partial [Zea mays]
DIKIDHLDVSKKDLLDRIGAFVSGARVAARMQASISGQRIADTEEQGAAHLEKTGGNDLSYYMYMLLNGLEGSCIPESECIVHATKSKCIISAYVWIQESNHSFRGMETNVPNFCFRLTGNFLLPELVFM